MMTMAAPSIGMTTSRIHARRGSVASAIAMPPMAMIGALAIIRCIMKVTCWTWVMSFVDLVISDEVPKRSSSRSENDDTREKTLERSVFPKPIADLAAKKPPVRLAATPMNAMASIRAPVRQISAISPVATPSSTMTDISAGKLSSAIELANSIRSASATMSAYGFRYLKSLSMS